MLTVTMSKAKLLAYLIVIALAIAAMVFAYTRSPAEAAKGGKKIQPAEVLGCTVTPAHPAFGEPYVISGAGLTLQNNNGFWPEGTLDIHVIWPELNGLGYPYEKVVGEAFPYQATESSNNVWDYAATITENSDMIVGPRTAYVYQALAGAPSQMTVLAKCAFMVG